MLALVVIVIGWWFISSGSHAQPSEGVVDVWSTWGDDGDQLQSLLDRFSQSRGIPVKVTSRIGSDDLLEALEGADPPDLVILSSSDLISALNSQGLVEPLDRWIETTGMGAKPTAQKIFNSGMQIPGFRRNIGSIEKVMQRYIPKVTVIGGAFIGFLTLVASLLGTLGSAGGTGLLLTVSIVYRLYEDIASEQMMEMHPLMRSFFGEQ